MATKKLYYEDPFLKDFSAVVLSCQPVDQGYAVTLDQTAFYPEGGGQAWDVGTLGTAQVTAVKEQGENVVHFCTQPLPVGQTVCGNICWEHRFDQMQQHTGEHILSGIVHSRYGLQNVGFHVGAETVTVDFDGDTPDLADLELAVNQAIWADIPLHIYTPESEELENLTYRTKRPLPWPVRIVEIPGIDRCACCAVHVLSTGQVGAMKILSCVRFHQGVRMEIVCGKRALSLFSDVYAQGLAVGHAFSAKLPEIGAAAREMCNRLAEEKLRANTLLRRIFAGIAEEHAGKGDCVLTENGLEPAQVRELCDTVAAVCGGVCAVFSGKEGGGCHGCIIGEKASDLGKRLCGSFSGRGGGKPSFFQGSLGADPEEIAACCRDLLAGGES